MPRRYLPAQPLREWVNAVFPGCHSRDPHEIHVTMRDLAELAGFAPRTIDRLWRRDQLTEQLVDAVCCRVLRVHPTAVYGEEWLEEEGEA